MSDAHILEARLYCRRGSFIVQAEFTLRSPWTLLFGPSGAGKTTILRVLAGLTQPNSGLIALGQTQLVDTARNFAAPPGRRKIGFVTQQAALFPHLTAAENIGFGLHAWTGPARRTRSEELLSFFEIDALAGRKPSQLSGGERQRVALARALAPRPDLLLLDEPFNALDVASRAAIIEKLRSTTQPVLYVSHDLADAWQLNADAILLEAGRIIAEGPSRTILASQRQDLLAQLRD